MRNASLGGWGGGGATRLTLLTLRDVWHVLSGTPVPWGQPCSLHAAAPSHWRLPATLEPPALGVLNEGPDQGEPRRKSFLGFSLHKPALFFYWA